MPAGEDGLRAPIPHMAVATMELTITVDPPAVYRWHVNDTTDNEHVGFNANSNVGQGGAPEPTMRWKALLQMDPTHDVILVVDSSVAPGPDAVPRAITPADLDVVALFFDARGTQVVDVHAGGPLDPHVADAPDDTQGPPWSEVVGVWMDDPVLDDGVFEIGIVAPRFGDLQADPAVNHGFDVTFQVLGQRYIAVAGVLPQYSLGTPYGYAAEWVTGLYRAPTGGGPLEGIYAGEPLLDAQNGTIRILVPTHAVGDPPAGVPFESVVGRSATGYRLVSSNRGVRQDIGEAHDVAEQEVRAFALGGPEVWAALRGDAAAPAAPSWFAAPLAAENIPNTLQVAGATLAVATFLGGLVLVRRRRTELARLLDDVDAVLDTHRDNPQRALDELDALGRRFDRMHREGRITESQHTALAVRIERAGYRLMRPQTPL